MPAQLKSMSQVSPATKMRLTLFPHPGETYERHGTGVQTPCPQALQSSFLRTVFCPQIFRHQPVRVSSRGMCLMREDLGA